METGLSIEYWRRSAAKDIPVIDSLFAAGHYYWALFVGHLVLEKTLKSRWIFDNHKPVPPKTHSLDKLARETNLKLDEQTLLWLVQVSDFNIEARYPDFKLEFYKRATKAFTMENIIKIKELHACILATMP